MNDKQERTYRLLKIVSYIMVAAVSFCAAALLFGSRSKLDTLERLIENKFVGTADTVAMEDAAAYAMVAALDDRWSYYIPASQYQSYQSGKTNSYVGMGISVMDREDDRGFDIVSVEPDSPAAQSGLLPGDILTAANGYSFAGVTTDILETAIPAVADTTAQLTILRAGETLHLEVPLRRFQTRVAKAQMLPGNIGYITIKNFNTNCASHTIAAIDEMIAQGATALVFDVRNNPGGYVTELVEVLDYLLPEGLLFRSVEDGKTTEYTSDESCIDLPMAVLVNGSSYSAAEFFAAALWEYDRAIVAGTQTCGKSYYQVTYRLGDGSAVGLSIGQYYTPNGVSLTEAGGLTPDIPVEADEKTAALIYSHLLDPAEDPQLQAAIRALPGE